MTQYYLHDGNQELGPFSLEQLKTHHLNSYSKIWHEGLADWTNAGDIRELAATFSKRTPPPFESNFSQGAPLTPPPAKPAPNFFKKKSNLYALIAVAVIALAAIIGWLIYQNSRHSEIIYSINDKIVAQENNKDEAAAKRQQLNAALTAKNMTFRNNWSDYISATSNAYLHSDMGGISNLEVLVSNDTDYQLDEVEVQVNYIKASGTLFKSETVYVLNVPAKGFKSASAPDSDRGTSVNMDIQSISSKKMHFCYSIYNGDISSKDPYFCK